MAKNSAAKAAKVQKDDTTVQGVDISVVQVALVTKALKAVDIDASDMSATEKVEALQSYGRKLPTSQKVSCAKCGGIANAELEACPFCGDEGEAEAEEEGEEEEADGKTKTSPVALVKNIPMANGLRNVTVEALDAANARILEIKERSKHDYWELGRALLDVYTDNLWKLRMKGKKVAYAGFNQYVAAELGISHTSAYNMMDVAKHFTEAKVKQIGGAKLSLVLMAPKSEQPGIIDDIEKGATRPQIKDKVKKAREKHKVTRRDTGRTKRGAGKPGAKKSTDGRITVAMVESSKTYELWAKPDHKLKDGEKPTKRAKALKDEPWALIKLANGVEQLIEVTGSSAGMKLKIITRRR